MTKSQPHREVRCPRFLNLATQTTKSTEVVVPGTSPGTTSPWLSLGLSADYLCNVGIRKEVNKCFCYVFRIL